MVISAKTKRSDRRRGATVVEMAFVVPVFFIFIFGLMEVNHAFMVKALLRSAAEQGARAGVADGVTSAEIEARVREVLGTAIPADAVTISIKDGSVFDNPGMSPDEVNYSALPDKEVADSMPRDLYIVRVELNYPDVSLLPPNFLRDPDGGPLHMVGQSVSRHE